MFREKVVDIEIEFQPTVKDCIEIALPSEEKFIQKLKDNIEKLGINNIRIIKKIERTFNLIYAILAHYNEQVLNQAIHTLCLYSFCFYYAGNDKSIPTFEYVKNIKHNLLIGSIDEEKRSDQEKQWNIFLGEYGYQYNDEIDLLLAEIVKNGYVPQDSLKEKAEILNKQFIESESISSYDDAWGLFHNSFADNQTEVVDGLEQSFKKNAQCLSPARLDNIVLLFRDLGEEKKADEIISIYIEAHKEDKYLFDLKNYPFGIDDIKIKERFAELAVKDKVVRSAQEVLADISGKNSWSQEDEEILGNTNSEEFYKIFKENNGKHLSNYIYTCLRFEKFLDASEQKKKLHLT